MRFWLSKNRITAIVLSAAVMLTSLTGCGARKGYDAPELIAPVSVSRIFRNPEMRDLKDVKYYEGVVVPTAYPVFYDRFMTVKEVKVKIGDYVEEGDVIAVGESVSQGMGYSEGTDGSEGVGIQRKIDDLEQSFRTQQTGKTDEQAEMERFRDKLIPMMQLLKTPAVPEEIKNYILKSFVKRIVFDRAKCDIEIFFNMSSTLIIRDTLHF